MKRGLLSMVVCMVAITMQAQRVEVRYFPRQAALHHMLQHREMCEGSAGREFCLSAEEKEDKNEGL